MLEIETVEPYPQDYAAVVQQSKQEIEANYKPDLKTKAENIASYDMIFVGSPIWWGTIAPPVVSFLVGNDFFGKNDCAICYACWQWSGAKCRRYKKTMPASSGVEWISHRRK